MRATHRQPGNELGRRLFALIRRKGHWEVGAAATAYKLNATQLWDIIHGRKSPTVRTLEKILKAMSATMQELYCDGRERD